MTSGAKDLLEILRQQRFRDHSSPISSHVGDNFEVLMTDYLHGKSHQYIV